MSDNTELVVHGNGKAESVANFVRRTMFKNVPDDELALTMLMAKRYDLDPVAKHIVVIRFNKQFTPYITRDGLLHVAHQSGQFDGMTCTYSKDDIGEYAEATVHRKDMSHPFVYRAYRHEYDTGKYTWGTHPIAMTTKTAEVIALRRAFDVTMTAAEEMDVAVDARGGEVIEAVATETTIDQETGEISPNSRPLTGDELERLFEQAKSMSLSKTDLKAAMDVENFNDYRAVAPYIAALEDIDAYIEARTKSPEPPATPKNGDKAEQPELVPSEETSTSQYDKGA